MTLEPNSHTPLPIATHSRTLRRMFFAYSLSKGVIETNPFDTKRVPTTSSRGKQKHYVSNEDAQHIMDRLPTPEHQLLCALARRGGMRVPSEPMSLRWTDIDNGGERTQFCSPKTEHHVSGGIREIPLFPELRGPLMEVRKRSTDDRGQVLMAFRHVSRCQRSGLSLDQ